MESWREVWRRGFVPQLTVEQLTLLRDALVRDDDRLIQGCTTTPPPMQCVQDWPCDGACLIGFCGWISEGLTTVAEVEEFFAAKCFNADQIIGELAACRHFLNWIDETPRAEAIAAMLPEVELAIEGKS